MGYAPPARGAASAAIHSGGLHTKFNRAARKTRIVFLSRKALLDSSSDYDTIFDQRGRGVMEIE
jgi:hypothetical protein